VALTPASRRRGIDTSVTRDRVLEAAEEMILSGVFAPATVTELAERADVSRATVFSRFGSKLGVLEALAVRCAGGPEMRAIRAAAAVGAGGGARALAAGAGSGAGTGTAS
jgi:AcrR family transcriptional regulator